MFGPLQGMAWVTPWTVFCRKRECPKNHIKYHHDKETGKDWAVIHLRHWKNESRKGGMQLLVNTTQALQVLDLMERASKTLSRSSYGLVFSKHQFRNSSSHIYSQGYFPHVLQQQLV